MSVCARVCVCVRACVCAGLCLHVSLCLRVCESVSACVKSCVSTICVWRPLQYIVDNVDAILTCMRRCNVSLRWVLLHR